jgi:hypothetical protein
MHDKYLGEMILIAGITLAVLDMIALLLGMLHAMGGTIIGMIALALAGSGLALRFKK